MHLLVGNSHKSSSTLTSDEQKLPHDELEESKEASPSCGNPEMKEELCECSFKS